MHKLLLFFCFLVFLNSCKKEDSNRVVVLEAVTGKYYSGIEEEIISPSILIKASQKNGLPYKNIRLKAVCKTGNSRSTQDTYITDENGEISMSVICGSKYTSILSIETIDNVYEANILDLEIISNYGYKIPSNIQVDITVSSITEFNVDSSLLYQMMNKIRNDNYTDINSILISVDNTLIFEEYFSGYDYLYSGFNFRGPSVNWDMNTKHNLHSTTKCFTATLVQLAIQQGYISSVQDKMFDYLPEYGYLQNALNKDITIEHLLSMTGGFSWNQNDVSLVSEANDLIRFVTADDPFKYILIKEIITEPGTSFYYNCGGINLLGKIVFNTTNMRIEEFSKQFLFDPLGIDDLIWSIMDNGMPSTSGDLYLRPRDMLKFGMLYQNNGLWMGKQLLSKDWIENSTKAFIDIERKDFESLSPDSYGYTWWIKNYTYKMDNFHTCYTSGWGGQHIIISPEYKTVIVFTGDRYIRFSDILSIMENYIVPALIDLPK